MKRIIALLLAITAGTTALASETHGQLDAATQNTIRTQLTEAGYEVRKIEADDGMYEAYALKDGKRYEIYLDREFNVVKTELDD